MTFTVIAERIGLALFVLPLLAGCAVGPDYTTPSVPVPASWANADKNAAAQPLQLADWWTSLDDPTLTALIEQAVQTNLDVAKARAKVREARATRQEKLGTLQPTLEATASATANRSASGTTMSTQGGFASTQTVSGSGQGVAASSYSLFQGGFDASWELDLFGANYRGVEAATYSLQATQEDLNDTLLTLIGDVAKYYVLARGYQARVALARRTAAAYRDTASLTRRKFEAGTTSAVDVAKAEGQTYSVEADILSLETSYSESVHRLGVLMGEGPAALQARLAATAPIPSPPQSPRTGLPADLLQRRPDVRKAERQLAQATANIGKAEAALYPSVSLTGNISTTGLQLGNLANASSIAFSIGPTLNVPLFKGGQLRAAVEVAQAQRDQYFIAFRSSILTALEDVENALVSLAQDRGRMDKLAASSRSYADAYELSRMLYVAGGQSFLDVLDAERSLYSARDTLLQTQVSAATSYISLCKGLGGGWNRPVDSSTPEIIDTQMAPHLRVRH
jgi:outer membrane protein, multidrug efflux system